MAPRGYTVGVIAGDGIGPEVVAEARKAAEAAGARFGFGLDWVDYDLGADRWLATGEALPDAVLEELRGVDAILLGAVGRPDVPPGVLERGLLLRLRFELDLYVNFRPVKLYPGVASPLADVKPFAASPPHGPGPRRGPSPPHRPSPPHAPRPPRARG